MLRNLQRKISFTHIQSGCGTLSLCRRSQLVLAPRIEMFGQGIRAFSALPSHKIVPMPSLSPTMESGSISRWNIKEGDRFDAGTALCDVETDKATVSFDATEEGYLAKILVGAGEVKVGQPIMVTVDEAGDVSAFKDFTISNTGSSPASPPPSSASATPPTPAVPSSPTPASPPPATASPPSSSNRIFASPLARKLARESTISIEQVFTALNHRGSGANNRIVSEDVKKAIPILASAPKTTSPATTNTTTSASQTKPKPATATAAAVSQSSGPFLDFEVADSARELAHRLTINKQSVPHYYVSVEMNLSNLMRLRDQFNSQQQLLGSKKGGGSELSVLDFLVKAAAAAMLQVPDVNAAWMETFVRRYDQVDINLVMGSGSRLATPVFRNVNGRGLSSLSSEIQQCETSLFSSDSQVVESFLRDANKQAVGTFTIHNLGVYGVKSAAPIVMSPQACALAFGVITETIIPRTVTDKDSEKDPERDWEVAPVMMATLSCDHRVVDGAVSAQYLSVLKQLVENPVNLLL